MIAASQHLHINDAPGSELVVIGAPDMAAMPTAIRRISDFISGAPTAPLRDIAYTCALESDSAASKIAIVATSSADLAEKLVFALHRLESGMFRNSFNRGIYIGTDKCPAPGRTVFMFPGEGTQYPDMLRGLALHFPACRAAFDAADTAVASAMSESGRNYATDQFLPSHYIFPTSTSCGDIRNLPTPTAIQTVLAADTALLFLFRQLGLVPDAVMGVGVGEIVALECAGSISLPDRRSRIMMLGEGFRMISEITASRKTVRDCATLSVAGIGRDALAGLLAAFGDDALIAADQTPELFTIAVAREAEESVRAALRGAGVSIHALPSINKPFHTPLMEPFASRFRDYYGSIVRSVPTLPVYSCCTQRPIEADSPESVADIAAMQWTRPINLSRTISRLYDDGFRVFVELGARGGITACVASTLKHRPHLAVATNRGHRPDMLQLHHALAALVSHGARFDVSVLHSRRGSSRLDLDRPGDYRPPRRQQEQPLRRPLPTFDDVAIPAGLVAAPSSDAHALVTRQGGEAPGATDFPCLDIADVVRFAPNDLIELSMPLGIDEFPYVRARALSAGPISAYAKNSTGLALPPLELLAEIMAEAARRLCPGMVVSGLSELRAERDLPDLSGSRRIRIQARQISSRGGVVEVAAQVYASASFDTDAPESLASCRAILTSEYPSAPDEMPLSLKNSIHAGWTHEDIYPTRLPSGECCRGIKYIPETGDNGLTAECFIPPRSGMIRSSNRPKFSISPACLAIAADALAVLHSRDGASGMLEIFSGAERVEFFAPPLAEWSPFTLKVSASQPRPGEDTATASVELIDSSHCVTMRISGLRSRIVRISRQLHRLILDPLGASMSDGIGPDLLPSLPHEVVCRKIDDDWPEDADEELRLRIAAAATLSPAEMERWRGLAVTRTRRHEWLFGRIAAKDSVRRCLLARYSRQLGAADIVIESDESGKPSPQGLWRRTCGAPMDISITHTHGCVVAAAAPNAMIGIDAERRDRAISEDFAAFAFSQLEQALAAESGDGATALFRFWCSKEALSKALGSGLRYGPNDLSARSLDPASGKVEMAASKFWLARFPQLRDIQIPVHTCLIGDLVMAVCALAPAIGAREVE